MEAEGDSVIVASFPKNKREAICVGISKYQGKTLVFIRIYVPSLTGELSPTRDGISLNKEKCAELINGIKALANVTSNERLVAQIQKNSKEEIRIAVSTYKDIPLIQIRTYAAYNNGDELRPTKKGVSMNLNLLPKLLESIDKLSTALDSLD